jgi:hypothetical protein
MEFACFGIVFELICKSTYISFSVKAYFSNIKRQIDENCQQTRISSIFFADCRKSTYVYEHFKYIMMKQIITILFIGLISFSIKAQDKTAKISFKSDTIDYGTIEKGADGLRVFEFTNTGDAPLIVSRVTSSCGCTVPKWSKDPIMPGDSGEIQVKYDTNRVNPIRKTITVISNAETPTVALKIKGEVIDSSKMSVLDKKSKSLVEQ